ncbi:MAG TPA: Ldh family oxidoreductase [Acidimicrobiia bacterium]|nr:Ldh family oxidoreductase [Acidimicrobiia bacterium]
MTATDPFATTIVGEAALRTHLERVLEALGVPGAEAALVADNLVEADLRGVDSHGSHLMALYFGRVRGGHLRAVSEVRTLRDDGSTVHLDGGLGFGQIGGVAAIDLGVERAKEFGVATVSIRELTHLGALAYYTMRASAAGCFAMAFQSGAMIVPPYGGTTSLFSTNPFSYAVPAGAHPDIVYDIATTAAAGNKILLARKRGDASIPEGWANDERGRPTTDPQQASISQLQWFGGHKGFGVGLLVEIMAGLLADSSFGRTEHSESELTGWDRIAKGASFVVLDVTRFLPLDTFRAHVDRLIDDVHASALAPGHDRVMVPGELEAERRGHRLVEGIPLPDALVAELDVMAAELGCPPLSC